MYVDTHTRRSLSLSLYTPCAFVARETCHRPAHLAARSNHKNTKQQ